MEISKVSFDKPIIPNGWDCESIETALKSETWKRIFNALVWRFWYNIDECCDISLVSLLSKEVADFSKEELLLVISLFSEWEASKGYERIQERIVWKVRNITVEELKEYFDDKIIEVGMRFVDFIWELGITHQQFITIMEKLGFNIIVDNNGKNDINYWKLKYNSVPIYFDVYLHKWRKVTEMPVFSNFENVISFKWDEMWQPIHGYWIRWWYDDKVPFWTESEKIVFFNINEWNFFGCKVETRDWNGKPISWTIKLEKDWIDIPFWSKDWDYYLFPGVDDYKHSEFTGYAIYSGKKCWKAFKSNGIFIPFWENMNWEYSTFEIVWVDERIEWVISQHPVYDELFKSWTFYLCDKKRRHFIKEWDKYIQVIRSYDNPHGFKYIK